MILHGIEYQRPTSLNMRIMADHVTYSFLAFMKSIFHFCLGCYCGGYSQNGRSNLSSCRCLHLSVRVSVCSSLPCVNPELVRIITCHLFELESLNLNQKCKTPCFGVHWPWTSRSIQLKSQNLSHFVLVHTTSYLWLKLEPLNSDKRCKTAWLRSLLVWGLIDFDVQGKI